MKNQSLYFIENQQGEVVRALPLDMRSSDELHVIFREDTKRMEVVSDLSQLNAEKAQYKLLETIQKRDLSQKKRHKLSFTNSELTLVEEVEEIQENIELSEDDSDKFLFYLKRTGIAGVSLAALILGISFFISKDKAEKEELHVVQVIDREKIEPKKIVKMSETPVAKTKVTSRSVQPKKIVVKKLVKNQFARKKAQSVQLNQMGALAVLGNVKNSTQKGGLRLDQAHVTAGPGRGGTQGSGGVQTAVYAKGIFAALVS